MKNPARVSLTASLLCGVALLTACEESGPEAPVTDTGTRWYDAAQVQAGAGVFAQYCAVCHGERAQGLADDWRERLDDGSFPPPPLNGTAHAWHHPLSVLLQVIDDGGVEFGGKMPGFAEVLSPSEKREAIAYFQNFWTDEIYAQWQQMGGVN